MSTSQDLNSVSWWKSSYSNGEGGACLEAGSGLPGAVPVRDSKRPDGPAITFSLSGWAAFVGAVKTGRVGRS